MTKHIWLHFTLTDLNTELRQLADEGRDLTGLQATIEGLRAADYDEPQTQRRLGEFFEEARSLLVDSGLASREPNDLGAIRTLRPEAPCLPATPGDLADRVHAAWLGRAAGCLLGKPLEGYRSHQVDWLLEASGNLPLTRYLRSDDHEPGAWDRVFGEAGSKDFLIDRCHGMPEDDDMNYTTTGLAVVERFGRDFTSDDIVDFWMDSIPILRTCTAERCAYRNFVLGIGPPRSAEVCNPYREWIGAQIRADFFGYINPGNPELAAEMAYRDARISHVRNGIYGEMWAAACIAAAFCTTDVRTILAAGLGQVPAGCRLALGIREVLAWRDEGLSLRQAIVRLRGLYDEDDWHLWTHTVTNAMVVAIGLLWGEGDYGRTICAAVEPLYDTDCNGATAGSIFGASRGTAAIPSVWTHPLADTLSTGVKGYERVSLSGMARRTLDFLPGV